LLDSYAFAPTFCREGAMSTEFLDLLVPCGLVAFVYGAGIVTGLVIKSADDWVQAFDERTAP